jgi:hypothetical protein
MNNKSMWVDTRKVHVSLLREEVVRRDPSINKDLLTRQNCLAYLSSHGVNTIPTTEYDRNTTELYSHVSEEGLYREIATRNYVFTNHYDEIEANSADATNDGARFSMLEYSGTHDITYGSLYIQNNLNVATLTLKNENIVGLLSNVMSDIRYMNRTLSDMRSNVDSFQDIVQQQNDIIMSTGNVFMFEHDGNIVSSEDSYCEYFMQSSIVNVHMRFTINNVIALPFSVRLPFPVRGRPFFRVRMHTATGMDSTVAKVHSIHDWLRMSSFLLNGDYLPMNVSIDGVYTAESNDFSEVTWITPMRFDERRDVYINPNDVTISTESLAFLKGSMQWNVIEQSTKLNTNMTLRVSASLLLNAHIVIKLPDSNERLHTENVSVIYGYGSTLLLPMSRHSTKPPMVYVDTQTKTLHVILDIVSPGVETVIISTHVVYYRLISLME